MPRVAKQGEKSHVHSAQARVKKGGADQRLSVINVPILAHALVFEGARGELSEAFRSSGAWNQCSRDGSTLLGATVVAPAGACGKMSNRALLVLPVSRGTGIGEVALEGFTYAGPFDIAEHVDKGKVGYHHRLYEQLQGGPPVSQRHTCA